MKIVIELLGTSELLSIGFLYVFLVVCSIIICFNKDMNYERPVNVGDKFKPKVNLS